MIIRWPTFNSNGHKYFREMTPMVWAHIVSAEVAGVNYSRQFMWYRQWRA